VTEATTATSIWQLVKQRSETDPDRILVMDENGGELTFGQLRERAESVAAGLMDLGIRPGDVVSWQLPSRIDTIVLFTALARLQAIQNPLIAMLRESEVEFICAQTRSRLLVVPSVFRGFDHLAMARSIAARPARARRRSRTADRRSGPAAARARSDDAAERERGALALLHVGHHRCPEGRTTHRPRSARRVPDVLHQHVAAA
jgi:non-ribosomal peptide synthetase component E (peptide arylation enzyme)